MDCPHLQLVWVENIFLCEAGKNDIYHNEREIGFIPGLCLILLKLNNSSLNFRLDTANTLHDSIKKELFKGLNLYYFLHQI